MVKIWKKGVNITKNKIKLFPKKSVELARPDELAADELARHPCMLKQVFKRSIGKLYPPQYLNPLKTRQKTTTKYSQTPV